MSEPLYRPADTAHNTRQPWGQHTIVPRTELEDARWNALFASDPDIRAKAQEILDRHHMEHLAGIEDIEGDAPLRCLIEQINDARAQEDVVIQFERAEINTTDQENVHQVLMQCPIEGCSAEFEVITNQEDMPAKLGTQAYRTARFICKQSKE